MILKNTAMVEYFKFKAKFILSTKVMLFLNLINKLIYFKFIFYKVYLNLILKNKIKLNLLFFFNSRSFYIIKLFLC